MRTTRSMSKRRREADSLSPPPSPPSVADKRRRRCDTSSVVTRSMSKPRREADRLPPPPSPAPVAVERRRRRGTSNVVKRSMSKNVAPKRKYMPWVDPSISYKGGSVIKAMLKRQHEKVVKYLKRDTTGETETYLTNVKVTRGDIEKFDTPEERIQALTDIGVIWCGGRPRYRNRIVEVAREYSWSEKLEIVLKIVIKNGKLPQRDVICLLSLSRMIHNNFTSCKSLWETLDLHGMENAGDRLVQALSLRRYLNAVGLINLEGARGIEEKHLALVRDKVKREDSLVSVASLNLDDCQNISDKGLKDITSVLPAVIKFSMRKNLLVTDLGFEILTDNCQHIYHLNLSGCQNITDKSLILIGDGPGEYMKSLDISRCEQVTDVGVIAVAEGCPHLQFLSLFGISGVTDRCLEALSENCSDLTTLDVNGCCGIELSQEKLLQLFPNLEGFSSS